MNMMSNMGKPAQASPMMFEMMMRRKGMADRFVRPGGMPENAPGLANQSQTLADQYAGAVEAQRAMGGMMAPQPALGGLAPMAAQMAADPQAVAAQEAMQMGAQASPRSLPTGAVGRPSPRLRQARGKMAAKRSRGRMTPMVGRRRKARR